MRSETKGRISNVLSVLFLFAIPFVIFGAPYFHNMNHWIETEGRNFCSIILGGIFFILLVYSIIRTVLILSFDKYLPQIPFPHTRFRRAITFAIISATIIAIATILVLALWLVVGTVGVFSSTFSPVKRASN